MTLTARQRGGVEARRAGDAFERWVAAQHRAALMAGDLAWIRHVSPAVKWVGSGNKARVIVIGDACADFVGMAKHGRAVVVEAKSRVGRLGKAQLLEQQVEQLDATAHGGGLALLLVELRHLKEAPAGPRYAVPWAEVPWSARGGVGHAELAPWLVDERDLYLRRFL